MKQVQYNEDLVSITDTDDLKLRPFTSNCSMVSNHLPKKV